MKHRFHRNLHAVPGMFRSSVLSLATLSLAMAFVSCTKKQAVQNKDLNRNDKKTDLAPVANVEPGLSVPSGGWPQIDAGSQKATYPGTDAYTPVLHIRGIPHIQVHGILDNSSFQSLSATALSYPQADRKPLFKAQLEKITAALGTHGKLVGVTFHPEIGYFSGYLPVGAMNSLSGQAHSKALVQQSKAIKHVKLEVSGLKFGVILDPVVVTPLSDKQLRKPSQLGLSALNPTGDGRDSNESFSGLVRMGLDRAFQEQIEKEVGSKVDGSSVNVGVVDTGVTMNHPTFENAEGKSRIIHMKDYTGEGRMFFNPSAKLEVIVPSKIPDGADKNSYLEINAQVLVAPSGFAGSPIADDFNELKNLGIQVSPELRALLLDRESGVRAGLMLETAFENARSQEYVDINQNGNTKDVFLAFYVPAKDGKNAQVYFDSTGKRDFRNRLPVSDWNTTKESLKLFAEKVGFDFKPQELTDNAGNSVTVMTASLVGFDPGNHGTHVTGIIAGRKIISNDKEDTLARGAAPNANLLVNRVCANQTGCISKEAIMDLASGNGGAVKADIINMSLGGLDSFNDGYGAEETAINRMTQVYNTLFVIAAGNDGPGRQTVGSPSTARLALTVGASASRKLIERQYQWPGLGSSTDKSQALDDDFMLFFSGRGPNAAGGFKPNLVAPGTELSAVQLNAAQGSRAGLDVYWGTSMATPAAAGAAAFLLDAARKYNASHPNEVPLPTDALTLRRVMIETAQPFDVNLFDPATGESRRGQYTWLDQGAGMLSIPRAWEALKTARGNNANQAVQAPLDPKNPQSPKLGVSLDYRVAVKATNPNGNVYDGTQGRYAQGVWIDPNEQKSIYQVQIARRLPEQYLGRADAPELLTALNTSKDEFVLKTTVFGSQQNWLKVGTLNQIPCTGSATANYTIIGQGLIDDPDTASDNKSGERSLFLCVDRDALRGLPPGDHGALIRAYRVTDSATQATEAQASFVVPVYINQPHKTLAGNNSYLINGAVSSFGVSRNYVEVPKGTSLVRVTLELPEAKYGNGIVTGCGSAELMALEASNVGEPKDIKPRLSNCDLTGIPTPETRRLSYERVNPKSGIWDLHVFGRYQYQSSPYALRVDYAKVSSTITEIRGQKEILQPSSFNLNIVESSFELVPDAKNSIFELFGLRQEVESKVEDKSKLNQPDRDGKVFRSYDKEVSAVTVTTGGAPGDDIDLYALECLTADATTCQQVGVSATATDEETITFVPKADRFYYYLVDGYAVSGKNKGHVFSETLRFAETSLGTLQFAKGSGEREFQVTRSLDAENSALLKKTLFTTGQYFAVGELTIRSTEKSLIATIPVTVLPTPATAPVPTPSATPL
jgi:subtilisin family serine protease